ncbi:MAG: hypothetical protein K9G76_00350 [Bacteroidales bacterium]|nr:hypothetical protein [Bacteroidales bacterium]MCF8402562.1 hypothetical protein [Bacteroidales bacterium]
MDFTFNSYYRLIDQLIEAGYSFQTISEFLKHPHKKVVLLRHDVEARYPNALLFAQFQYQHSIKGTYYFRFLKNHYDSGIIKEIAALGHEIGYHYDDLSYTKGEYEAAIERFQKNLNTLREIAPVKTICMEGAPASKHDNRDLWNKYNFSDYQIESEPYLSLDFSQILYLTDTGRSWSGKFSVRDKSTEIIGGNKSSYKTTGDIINALSNNNFPNAAMLTFHPQRWNNSLIPWTAEFVLQNIKNQLKKIVISLGE